jgi:putative oxidoreductase
MMNTQLNTLINGRLGTDYGITLLRISLGIVYLVHSLYLKVVVFTIPGTVAFFESIGLPGFTAYLTIFVEAFGGAMLLLGWNTRLAAFTNTGGGWEYPLFLAVATAAQLLLGNGAIALSKNKY